MVQWQVIVLFINSPVQDSNNDTGVSFIYHYSLILQLPVPITQVEHIQVIPWGGGGEVSSLRQKTGSSLENLELYFDTV